MQRYRDIVFTLSRYGFGYVAMEMGLYDLLSMPKRMLSKDKTKHPSQTTGERIRLFLEDLGPTFIKLGQFASTRSDIFPQDIIKELEKLQENVPPFSSGDAKLILEKELGNSVEELFNHFEEKPLAAASIGQVHRGILKTGENVAIKIQRPDIKTTINTDLEILDNIARLAESRLEWASRYQIRDIIDEFSKSLRKELDYTNEGRNAEKISKQFADNPHIRIPNIYWDYSTKQVLTMEFIKGIKLHDEEKLKEFDINNEVLAERIIKSMFQQVFIDGFFHGDPHPGNIMTLPGEEVVYLDFGLVGFVTSTMKKHLSSFVIALMRQSTDGIIKTITKMGVVPNDTDMKRLRTDVDLLRIKYYDIPLSEVSLGESINDLFAVTYTHHIHLPSDLALLGKALLTIEGIVEKLDPNISIIKMAEPFGKQLLKQRYNPKSVAEDIVGDIAEYGDLLTELPTTINELKSVINKGKVRLEINVPSLDRSLKKLDQISNRLSFSIVLLSFSIIMTGLIIGSAVVRQSTLLWDIPVIEIGFIVATLMFLMILFGIFRSGRF